MLRGKYHGCQGATEYREEWVAPRLEVRAFKIEGIGGCCMRIKNRNREDMIILEAREK